MTVINVYMIRHGFSETNHMQRKGILGWVQHLFKRDPSLVKEGVDNSIRKGNWLRRIMNVRPKEKQVTPDFKFIDYSSCNSLPPKFDMIFCSELLRAIETAVCMFENRKIYVIPYISEIQGYQNIKPLSLREQQNVISTKYPKANVVWTYRGASRSRPDFRKFKTFLRELISKEIKSDDQDEYHVAVVSHSLYMMKYVISPKTTRCMNGCYAWRFKVDKPKNNDIIQFKIN